MTSASLITFIIPSIGRETLGRSLNSLLDQTKQNWKAIVIFDGIDAEPPVKDPRISSFKVAKTGKSNHAGEVRNLGMEKVTTDWIGFLDDDDIVSKYYVERLQHEISLKDDLECVIHRMWNGALVLPSATDLNFKENKVGISFSIKREVGAKFTPSSTEDFKLLDDLRNDKRKMLITPTISYFVNGYYNPQIDDLSYLRILINY